MIFGQYNTVKLLDYMIGYIQVVYEPTHISWSQVDDVYLKSALRKEFHTKVIVQKIFLFVHNVVRIVFQKNRFDFTVSK